MQCNSSKNPMNDEMVLTVAMVIGKVALSAKKAAARTDEEFKPVVKTQSKKTTRKRCL